MRVLLDTNALLWAAAEPDRLFPHWHDIVADTSNQVYASAVSVAEIAIKAAIGKLSETFTIVGDDLVPWGFIPLAFDLSHARAMKKLPLHHRDPFDRMIIAQAVVEDLPIMTTDQHFSAYSEVRLVPRQ